MHLHTLKGKRPLTKSMKLHNGKDVMTIPGNQITDARNSLGETQREFGQRFLVDQATVSRWEQNGLPDRGLTAVAVKSFLNSMGIGRTAHVLRQQPRAKRRRA